MKRFCSFVLIALLVFSFFSFSGCKKTEQSQVLRICNCEDYIDESLIEKFQEETGIKVEYSTYGTNENLYNELVINPNSYDLVVPSEYMIQKLAAEGRIQKLDFSRLSDYEQNLSPFIKERIKNIKLKDGSALYDYMVGYMWGTMGWVYNTDYVTEQEVSSWDGVFYNSELKKKITIKDAVRDSYLVGLAMCYKTELEQAEDNQTISEILNRTDEKSISLVGEKLSSLKAMLYGFEVDSGKNDIILGNIYAYVAWSGDAAYAIDVASGETEDEDGSIVEENKRRNLSYYIPEEGSNIWFDGLVMPSGSSNYDAVYKFLEFISRSESVYDNMNYIGYTSVMGGNTVYNDIVLDWFDESEDLDEDSGITVDLSYYFGEGDYTLKVSEENFGRLIAQYPTEQIVERCAVMSYFEDDALMSINEMWEGVKGETFSLWIIVLTLILVLIIAIFIILFRNKDKIKFLKIPEKKISRLEKRGYKIIEKKEIR